MIKNYGAFDHSVWALFVTNYCGEALCILNCF